MMSAPPPKPLGLRERKKQRTQATLHQVAMRLFLERGYTATTISEIAAAADVAPRTFFTHFESKEAVLFADIEPALQRLNERLASPARTATALEELRAWLEDDLLQLPAGPPEHEEFLDQVIAEVPAVQQWSQRLITRVEHQLAASLAADLKTEQDDPTPHIVAAAAIAALYRSTLFTHWDERRAETLAILDRAFFIIQHGVGALSSEPFHPR